MQLDSVWSIATATKTHYRECSFGGRSSSRLDMHKLCWDPVSQSFMRGDLHGFGTGNSWNWKVYPCRLELAEAILALCMTDEINRRFLGNSYSEKEDVELFLCCGTLVSFRRSKAMPGRGLTYLALASFSFQFYDADWKLHTVRLGHDLTQRFAESIRAIPTGDRLQHSLTKSRIAA